MLCDEKKRESKQYEEEDRKSEEEEEEERKAEIFNPYVWLFKYLFVRNCEKADMAHKYNVKIVLLHIIIIIAVQSH